MTEIHKTEDTIYAEDRIGNVYELGLPPQYLQCGITQEDYDVYLRFSRQLGEIVSHPERDHGIILPNMRDEHGQPLFYFNIHHKSKPKYKYREVDRRGDIEHIYEADTIERINELKWSKVGHE